MAIACGPSISQGERRGPVTVSPVLPANAPILRALELLEGGQTIREVARACGFAELSPFYRAYRRWHGCTPRAGRGRLG